MKTNISTVNIEIFDTHVNEKIRNRLSYLADVGFKINRSQSMATRSELRIILISRSSLRSGSLRGMLPYLIHCADFYPDREEFIEMVDRTFPNRGLVMACGEEIFPKLKSYTFKPLKKKKRRQKK